MRRHPYEPPAPRGYRPVYGLGGRLIGFDPKPLGRVRVVRGRRFVRLFVGKFSITLGWLGPL